MTIEQQYHQRHLHRQHQYAGQRLIATYAWRDGIVIFWTGSTEYWGPPTPPLPIRHL